MNYDLDTEEGMRNAVNWTNHTLSLLVDGGRWAVPRSGTIVTVLDGLDKRCAVYCDRPDPAILRVLTAAGWTFSTAIINTIEE